MWGWHLGEGDRFFLAVLLGVPFVLGSVYNWAIVLRWTVTRKRQPSFVPFAGLVGALAVFLSLPAWRRYAWVPLLLDPSCVLFLVYGGPMLAIEAWKHSRMNLISRYVAVIGGRRKVTLSLYKKDFVLEQDIHRSPGELGITHIGVLGAWQETPEGIALTVYEGRILLRKDGSGLRQVQGYADYEEGPDLALAELVLERITYT